MLHAFTQSLRQLFTPAVASVFVKSFLVTLLVFAAAAVGCWYGLHWLFAHWAPARAASDWAFGVVGGSGTVADLLTLVLMLLASWLLFRAVAIAVVGLFGDQIVAAVEKRYYPEAHAQARSLPFLRALQMGLGSAGRAIALNLLFAPIYLILLVTGVGSGIVFFALNGWLLGRDLGDMVASRHLAWRELPAWRSQTVLRRFALGAFATALFLVPVLNLVAPVVGAAMATHAFHRGRR